MPNKTPQYQREANKCWVKEDHAGFLGSSACCHRENRLGRETTAPVRRLLLHSTGEARAIISGIGTSRFHSQEHSRLWWFGEQWTVAYCKAWGTEALVRATRRAQAHGGRTWHARHRIWISPDELPFIHFSQQEFVVGLLCARHCAKCWDLTWAKTGILSF